MASAEWASGEMENCMENLFMSMPVGNRKCANILMGKVWESPSLRKNDSEQIYFSKNVSGLFWKFNYILIKP